MVKELMKSGEFVLRKKEFGDIYDIEHLKCCYPWVSRLYRLKSCVCGKEIPKELLFIAEMLGWGHTGYVRTEEELVKKTNLQIIA